MRISIKSLLKKSGNEDHFQDSVSSDELSLENEQFRIEDSWSLDLHLLNIEDVIHLEGYYSGSLGFQCSRCLSPGSMTVAGDVEARFYPESQYGPEGPDRSEVAQGNDDLYIRTYSDDEILFDDILEEDVLLSTPMQPLCMEDCEGLCPECGTNLNEDECDHEKHSIDPRLAELQNIDLDDES